MGLIWINGRNKKGKRMKTTKLTILLAILALLAFGCSTGEERRALASNFGEVVYQEFPTTYHASDVLIVKQDDGSFIIVRVTKLCAIYEVEKLNIKCAE